MTFFKKTSLALGIAGGLLCACSSVQAQTTDQRVGQLEQQVKNLQQQVNHANQERLHFNGFLSVGYGVANNDGGYAGLTEDDNFDQLSLFGLQGAFDINDSTKVTMQLVSRGREGWDPSMEWAYISHRVNNNLTMRAGKMRMPLFMYSDSLEVGYAQPWTRPPVEVYGGIPITSYTGLDGIYDINLDNSTLSLQGFTGETNANIDLAGTDTNISVDNLYGAVANWTDFVWTLRGNFASTDISANGKTYGANFYGLGFGYNNGTWQVISELTRLKVDGPIVDADSGYITLTRTFGSVSPYITYSMRKSIDNEDRPLTRAQVTTTGSPVYGFIAASDIQNVDRKAFSVGVRWDVMSSVAVKFDITRASSFGDTGGGLSGNNGPTIAFDSTSIYTIKIDSAF